LVDVEWSLRIGKNQNHPDDDDDDDDDVVVVGGCCMMTGYSPITTSATQQHSRVYITDRMVVRQAGKQAGRQADRQVNR
jgi:hypothetical protein